MEYIIALVVGIVAVPSIIGIVFILSIIASGRYPTRRASKPIPHPLPVIPISLPSVGSLTVYTGPMFCGKTTRLIQDLTRYTDTTYVIDPNQSRRSLLINSKIDNRDPNHVVSSHSSSYRGISDRIDVVATHHLSDVDISQYTVIGIDEAQFFPDLFETVEQWVRNGKHVYCAGLDGDREMKKFGHLADLLNIADSFTKLSSVCSMCLEAQKGQCLTPSDLRPAPFTACISSSQAGQIQVGGADIYRPVCREHFYALKKLT